jgi:hypothetical protein
LQLFIDLHSEIYHCHGKQSESATINNIHDQFPPKKLDTDCIGLISDLLVIFSDPLLSMFGGDRCIN